MQLFIFISLTAEVAALSRCSLRHLFLQPRQHGYFMSATLRVLIHPVLLWEKETDLAGIFQYIYIYRERERERERKKERMYGLRIFTLSGKATL